MNLSRPVPEALAVPSRLRVVLAEDHEQMRELLRLVLKGSHDVMGSFRNGRDLVEAAARLSPQPHVILIDIAMPQMGGLAAARTLRETLPNVPIIFVTHHVEPEYLAEAGKIGARGYVLKTRIVQELRIAIRQVWQGGTFSSPGLPIVFP